MELMDDDMLELPQWEPPVPQNHGWLAAGCPLCGVGARLDENRGKGEVTCTECGLVIHERLTDDRPEWRSMYDADDAGGANDRSRVGDPSDADKLTLRIGPSAPARTAGGGKTGGPNVRLLHRHNAAAQGMSSKTREVEAESRSMCDVLRMYLMYTDPMVELSKQMYTDYNMEVQRIKGNEARAAAQSACAYISSGVNGQSGERRDMDEVCLAFCSDKDAAHRFCSQLREKLADKPYRDVLLRRTDVMDAAGRRIWDMPPELLPQGLLRPVVNLAEWVRASIGKDAAGTKDPVKFGNSIIALAVIECCTAASTTSSMLLSGHPSYAPPTGKELAKELKIGVPTFTRNDELIRKAIRKRIDEGALAAKVAELVKRCERVAMMCTGRRAS
jgi:transcription initiation factor TFIIB